MALTTNLQTSLNVASGARAAADAASGAAVEVRYGQVGMVQVRIRTLDTGALLDELTGRVATAPHFFRRTGVCLDLSALPDGAAPEQIRAVIDALRRAGMLAVGLAGEEAALETLSNALNLPVLTSVRAPVRAVPVVQPAGFAAAEAAGAAGAAPKAAGALVHAQNVRSGQRLFARERDLIVIGSVGAGAEVIADGCVHVYGALRGRAMAGAHGDGAARVFCQDFQAELVSVAGVFRVFETVPAELAGKPVQAWLAGEALCCERIGG